jgi:hypothetical protein
MPLRATSISITSRIAARTDPGGFIAGEEERIPPQLRSPHDKNLLPHI